MLRLGCRTSGRLSEAPHNGAAKRFIPHLRSELKSGILLPGGLGIQTNSLIKPQWFQITDNDNGWGTVVPPSRSPRSQISI